jgi:hypothetical protein
MEYTCISPGEGLDLRLNGLPDGDTLVVHLLVIDMTMHGVKNTPHQGKGAWCYAKDRTCDPVEATITFKKFNRKKDEASGTYVVEFSDGHRQQGLFHVVGAPQPPVTCE